MELTLSLAHASLRLAIGLVIVGASTELASAQALPYDADLKLFAVHINRTPPQSWPGYGVYLGNGLVLTAEHVTGHFWRTKPHVLFAGQDLPAALVKEGSIENVDLTLLSIDSTKLPDNLRTYRMPLCTTPPIANETVDVATPEGTARSYVLSEAMVPADVRGRFGTVIGDAATTGNSGSGVFDAQKQCLLGIVTRKVSFTLLDTLGAVVSTGEIGKYFVPASEIQAFIPEDEGVEGAPNGISVPRWSLSKPLLKESPTWASLSGILLLLGVSVLIWQRGSFRFMRSTRRARSLWRASSDAAS